MGKKEIREKKGRGEAGGALSSLAKAVCIGAAVSAAAGILLLAACAVAIWGGLIRMELSLQAGIAACAAGGLIGGCVGVRRAGCRALPVGAGVGLLFFLILAAVGLMVTGAEPGAGQLPVLLACLCSGGLSGLTGGRRKKRRNA